ncbi:MAG TPA: ABC transporter permease [Segeticoccus sp.]|uniref:ABC transporter permease n=1 Tax=Segeticoccus sp. TaxID=2706531 RepID=UPI002D80328C|nr:ABC transporter permease [Segeticoccus sp.]HET8601830.1 ABC transporter permease [Segeticoccus sp.]
MTEMQATEIADPEATKREPDPGRSLWSDAWHDLIRNPLFIIPMLVVLAVVSMAIAPQLWTSVNPHDCNIINSKQGPSDGHPFGFNVYGCDMYSQVIYGARPDVIIAVVCTLGTTVLGVLFGTVGAYFGGWVDVVISRLTDIFFGLPFILAGLIFLAIVGSHSVWAISILLIAFGWPQMTRIVRGSVLEAKSRDYIEATRILGAKHPRIIFRHILPNAIQPAIVIATIALGGYVSAEATLTYLGVGLQQPTISWGVLISGGQEWAVSGHPHLLIYPCLFLVATVLSFILLGDAFRDALDPKLR